MKTFSFLVGCFLFFSCVSGREKIFTGSTPANHVIRNFLGISLADSIDFIRWKLSFDQTKYSLSANYGIGKPNTNGFIAGGKWARFSGELKKGKDIYWLTNGNRAIELAILNDEVLHLVNPGGSLMRGTAGWSYTLSIEKSSATNPLHFVPKKFILKDSMAYEGRTPCLDFADIQKGKDCYKLKWSIVLFADPTTNTPAGFRLRGTAVQHQSKTGTWVGGWTKSSTGNERIVYQLNLEEGKPLYFILPDENILLLTDNEGNLLVGNEDFSYTLNRKN